jgi:hypothetical protein
MKKPDFVLERRIIMKKKLLLTIMAIIAMAVVTAEAGLDDFSTDPSIGSEWTQYVTYVADAVTTTWNSTDQDLDLVKDAAGESMIGLYRTDDHERSAMDPMTLTVKDLSRGAGASGSWAVVGLMISAVAEPDYVSSGADSYTFRMDQNGAGAQPDGGGVSSYIFQIARTLADGAGRYLYTSPSAITFSDPVKLDIVRVGDDYQFLADGVLLYTSGDAAGDFYDTAAKDSLVNYGIVVGSDVVMTATVDNFGVVPEPATMALLAFGGLLLRRRK